MILQGILLAEKKEEFQGKNGKFTVRQLKVRDTLSNGDEKHVYIKVYGENGIKGEIGKPIKIEFFDQVKTGKDRQGNTRTFINKVAVV